MCTREYVATQHTIYAYRRASTMTHPARQQCVAWGSFSVATYAAEVVPSRAPAERGDPPRPSIAGPSAVYSLGPDPPPALRVEYASRAAPRRAGGVVGPRYRALGVVEGPTDADGACLWRRALRDDFVGLMPPCSHAHGPEHPRRCGTVPCSTRDREGGARTAPTRHDRYA